MNFSNHANETVAKILNDCWHLHMPHVVIIMNVGTKYAIYTFYPYSVGICSKAIPVIKEISPDRWGNCRAVQMFTSKLKNFYGCPLVLVTFHNVPHMIIRKNEISNTFYTDGIDGRLMRGLAEAFNFKLNVKVAEEKGLIHVNGTITGAFKMVTIIR